MSVKDDPASRCLEALPDECVWQILLCLGGVEDVKALMRTCIGIRDCILRCTCAAVLAIMQSKCTPQNAKKAVKTTFRATGSATLRAVCEDVRTKADGKGHDYGWSLRTNMEASSRLQMFWNEPWRVSRIELQGLRLAGIVPTGMLKSCPLLTELVIRECLIAPHNAPTRRMPPLYSWLDGDIDDEAYVEHIKSRAYLLTDEFFNGVSLQEEASLVDAKGAAMLSVTAQPHETGSSSLPAQHDATVPHDACIPVREQKCTATGNSRNCAPVISKLRSLRLNSITIEWNFIQGQLADLGSDIRVEYLPVIWHAAQSHSRILSIMMRHMKLRLEGTPQAEHAKHDHSMKPAIPSTSPAATQAAALQGAAKTADVHVVTNAVFTTQPAIDNVGEKDEVGFDDAALKALQQTQAMIEAMARQHQQCLGGSVKHAVLERLRARLVSFVDHAWLRDYSAVCSVMQQLTKACVASAEDVIRVLRTCDARNMHASARIWRDVFIEHPDIMLQFLKRQQQHDISSNDRCPLLTFLTSTSGAKAVLDALGLHALYEVSGGQHGVASNSGASGMTAHARRQSNRTSTTLTGQVQRSAAGSGVRASDGSTQVHKAGVHNLQPATCMQIDTDPGQTKNTIKSARAAKPTVDDAMLVRIGTCFARRHLPGVVCGSSRDHEQSEHRRGHVLMHDPRVKSHDLEEQLDHQDPSGNRYVNEPSGLFVDPARLYLDILQLVPDGTTLHPPLVSTQYLEEGMANTQSSILTVLEAQHGQARWDIMYEEHEVNDIGEERMEHDKVLDGLSYGVTTEVAAFQGTFSAGLHVLQLAAAVPSVEALLACQSQQTLYGRYDHWKRLIKGIKQYDVLFKSLHLKALCEARDKQSRIFCMRQRNEIIQDLCALTALTSLQLINTPLDGLVMEAVQQQQQQQQGVCWSVATLQHNQEGFTCSDSATLARANLAVRLSAGFMQRAPGNNFTAFQNLTSLCILNVGILPAMREDDFCMLLQLPTLKHATMLLSNMFKDHSNELCTLESLCIGFSHFHDSIPQIAHLPLASLTTPLQLMKQIVALAWPTASSAQDMIQDLRKASTHLQCCRGYDWVPKPAHGWNTAPPTSRLGLVQREGGNADLSAADGDLDMTMIVYDSSSWDTADVSTRLAADELALETAAWLQQVKLGRLHIPTHGIPVAVWSALISHLMPCGFHTLQLEHYEAWDLSSLPPRLLSALPDNIRCLEVCSRDRITSSDVDFLEDLRLHAVRPITLRIGYKRIDYMIRQELKSMLETQLVTVRFG